MHKDVAPEQVRQLFDKLHRDPGSYPLFKQLYDVLQFAPSSKHSDPESFTSIVADALDYLEADGRYTVASPTGRTSMQWDGSTLHVHEDNDRDWTYEHDFRITEADFF